MAAQSLPAGTASAEAQFFEWTFPGAPVRIQLSLEIIPRVWEWLAGPLGFPAEAGGILLGTTAGNSVEITGFEPFPRVAGESGLFAIAGEDRTRFDALLKQPREPVDHSRVVGYFRGQTRDDLRLYDEDLALIHEFFRDPASVFLVVRPQGQDGSPTAAFFFWDQGSVWGDFTFMPFPFDPDRLPRGSRRLETEAADLDAHAEDKPAQAAVSHPLSRRRASLWTAVGAAALLVLSMAIYWPKGNSHSALNTGAPVNVAPGSLSLSATRSGSNLAISWNAAAPAVRDARVGVLNIQDGSTRRELSLTAQMLRENRIVYTPTSETVNIALELFNASGTMTRDTVLVVLNGKPDHVAEASVETQASRPAAPPLKLTVPVVVARDPVPESVTRKSQPRRQFTVPTPVKAPPVALDAPAPNVMAQSALPALPPSSMPAPAISVPRPAEPRAQEMNPAPPPVLPRALPQSAAAVIPPRAVHQAQPVLSANVRNMISQEVEIRVKVMVDAAGRVTRAEAMAEGGAVGKYLATAAAAAARVWRFEPARQDDRPVPSELVLEFRFTPAKKR